MKNSAQTSSRESSLSTVLSHFWEWVTGAKTLNEVQTPSTETSSFANKSHKRRRDASYNDAERAKKKIPKAQTVEPTLSRDEQAIQKHLPVELEDAFQMGLYPYLSNRNLIGLSESFWQLRNWTQFERERRALSLSFLAVVQGKENKAKRLLASMPSLLINKNSDVIDYSGRQIKGLTLFQAALCAGDVEMCEMMRPYFAQLKGGEDELKKQYHEIFPNGIDAHVEQQKREVFDFNPILQAIKNASDTDVLAALNKESEKDMPLNEALKEFREQFHNKSLSETIYNPQHLLRAFQMYEDEFFRLLDWNKRDLLWRQVIGFVQRYMPACYAQAFAYGLLNMVDNIVENPPLSRSFNFKYSDKDECIVPLKTRSGLGYDFGVNKVGPSTSCRRGFFAHDPFPTLGAVQKLCRVKTSSLQKLLRPIWGGSPGP